MKVSLKAHVLNDYIQERTDKEKKVIGSQRYLLLYQHGDNSVMNVKVAVPDIYINTKVGSFIGKEIEMKDVEVRLWEMNDKSGISFRVKE